MLFKRKKQIEKPTPKIIESTYKSDRRDSREDRRAFGPPTNFPVVDSDKKLVQKDRRSTRPDRRVNSIVVTETRIALNRKV